MTEKNDCLVLSYDATSMADVNVPAVWERFTGKVLKEYENTALVDISHSPELSQSQLHATQTKKIIVRKAHIQRYKFIGGKSAAAAQLDKSSMAAANKRKANQQAAAAERRRQLTGQLIQYFKQGMSLSQSAREVGINPTTASRCLREAKVDQPERKRCRLVGHNGDVMYFDSMIIGVARQGGNVHTLRNKGRIEVKAGYLESGSWIEWDGQVHKYTENSEIEGEKLDHGEN